MAEDVVEEGVIVVAVYPRPSGWRPCWGKWGWGEFCEDDCVVGAAQQRARTGVVAWIGGCSRGLLGANGPISASRKGLFF